MSAAEEDTELRDLLIHTLENNGVLNRMKAELRASVFLALEEQDRAEHKPALLNEKLRHFLDTREGRLVAGLVTDFLQHFHLDFTLAVLQPEANLPNSTEERAQLARELGLPEAGNGAPLLLELLRNRELSPTRGPSSDHLSEAEAKFQLYDRDKSGEISKEELRELFVDLFPHFHMTMLDRYVNDEFAAADKDFSSGIDLQEFLAMYRRLFIRGRSVVSQDVSELLHPQTKLQLDTKSRTDSLTDKSSSSSRKSPDSLNIGSAPKQEDKLDDHQLGFTENEDPKLDEHDLEGDSFFDDPIPKPVKTYGWKEDTSKPNSTLAAFLNLQAQKLEHKSHPEATDDDDSPHDSLKNLKSASEKIASLELGGGNEDDYADDFNSTSQRSDKSEVSIGEDLDEELSVDDFTGSDNKLEDITLDNSISHISDVADYLEDVS